MKLLEGVLGVVLSKHWIDKALGGAAARLLAQYRVRGGATRGNGSHMG